MVCGGSFNLLPIPDGAYDAGDRQHLLGFYRGITFAGANTLNLRIKFGTSVLMATGAITQPSGASDLPFEIQGFFVVRTIGNPATLVSSGRYDNGQTAGLLAAQQPTNLANTTIDNDIQASAEWGTASADNSITAQNIIIERYDPI